MILLSLSRNVLYVVIKHWVQGREIWSKGTSFCYISFISSIGNWELSEEVRIVAYIGWNSKAAEKFPTKDQIVNSLGLAESMVFVELLNYLHRKVAISESW